MPTLSTPPLGCPPHSLPACLSVTRQCTLWPGGPHRSAGMPVQQLTRHHALGINTRACLNQASHDNDTHTALHAWRSRACPCHSHPELACHHASTITGHSLLAHSLSQVPEQEVRHLENMPLVSCMSVDKCTSRCLRLILGLEDPAAVVHTTLVPRRQSNRSAACQHRCTIR